MQHKSRPVFLELFTLLAKMSVNAKASILHRLSGVLLVVSIPFIIYVFHQSLVSQDFYTTLYGVVSNPIVKILYIIFIWCFIYHLCSGVRFLFIDIHKGVEIRSAKLTARIVILTSIVLTILLGAWIW